MPRKSKHQELCKRYTGHWSEDLHILMDGVPKHHSRYRLLTHNFSFVKYIEGQLGTEVAKEVLAHILADEGII